MLADNHTSLMHGWVPGVVQILSVPLLLVAADVAARAGSDDTRRVGRSV